jgi:hypothetical protein
MANITYKCALLGCPNIESASTPLKVCSRCRNAKYCSVECQTLDWNTNHKYVCKSFVTEEMNDLKDFLDVNIKTRLGEFTRRQLICSYAKAYFSSNCEEDDTPFIFIKVDRANTMAELSNSSQDIQMARNNCGKVQKEYLDDAKECLVIYILDIKTTAYEVVLAEIPKFNSSGKKLNVHLPLCNYV